MKVRDEISDCGRCGAPFVWRRRLDNVLGEHYQQKAPHQCRACDHEVRATLYDIAATKHERKARDARARIKRSVARVRSRQQRDT